MQTHSHIDRTFQLQKRFFAAGNTQDIAFRKQSLQRLKDVVLDYQPEIEIALDADLGKSKQEVQNFEIDAVVGEIDFALAHLDRWIAEENGEVLVPEIIQPSRGYIRREAYGVSYIIGPFNYPINLTFCPLVGAIIGGNTAIIKPSENTPQTAKVIEDMITEAFPEEYIKVYQGAIEENTYLLSLPFDFIFFTGSPAVGKVVMAAAAKYLTPFVLELGGKSPFIVEKTADLARAVQQLLFGKLLNSGQTCIAPDYVYIDKTVKDEFVRQLTAALSTEFLEPGRIGKVVTVNQLDKLAGYLEKTQGKIVIGGKFDRQRRYFQPTVIDDVDWDDALMQQELFGPLIPVMTFDDIDQVPAQINQHFPKPLALYIFTADEAIGNRIIDRVQSGDAQINGVLVHAVSPYFPFGGIGPSGIGEYHGKFSYQAFTHRKSVRIVP